MKAERRGGRGVWGGRRHQVLEKRASSFFRLYLNSCAKGAAGRFKYTSGAIQAKLERGCSDPFIARPCNFLRSLASRSLSLFLSLSSLYCLKYFLDAFLI